MSQPSNHPRTLLALNWKMNKTPSEAGRWAKQLQEELPHSEAEVVVLAPAIDLSEVAAHLYGSGAAFGGQDVSQFESGAYTGETSAAMLRDVGASYVIVGHSERRAYHAETDQLVAAKTRAAIAGGLIPIVCVGEGLDVRERGEQVAYTIDQLRESLQGVMIESGAQLVVAYEPVWAIGTGRTATAGDAQQMGAAIREALSGLFQEYAQGVRVLYGGSVKPGNIREMVDQPDVHGCLVGGASLELDSVLGMIRALG